MNSRILLVDDAPQLLTLFERMLEPDYDIRLAPSIEGAREHLESAGPFAVVVADHDLAGTSGTELLEDVRTACPETVGILISGGVEPKFAIDALQEDRVFRYLPKPFTREQLCAALDRGLSEYARRDEERRSREELDFSRRALEDFNSILQGRLKKQTSVLIQMHRYVHEINLCGDLGVMAEVTANAVHRILDRGARVELWRPSDPHRRWSATAGSVGAESLRRPIEIPEGELGALEVALDGGDRTTLSETDRSMLASMTSSLASAARSWIRRTERDEAQVATILALARLAETRDNETGKHLERVSEYCRRLAIGLRESGRHAAILTDGWIQDLVLSAPLHDIGKVGIPDSILLKPAKLDADEWKIMKTHTDIGAETLQRVMAENPGHRFLQISLDIAWCHHEKWDGSGYPRGLCGEDIPLAARILALADVYDALTTERPYKGAWAHEEAVALIAESGGTQFDPALVAVFLDLVDEFDAVRERLRDRPEDIEALRRRLG